jgi:cobalt-precorrin-5B (C1)-methyltransferase
MSRRPQGQLRKGWTTGACATAAAHAAYEAVLSGAFPDPVTITLPKGEQPSFALAEKELVKGAASAGIIKDAGDDPDVTHGALIMARVELATPGAGVSFHAGDGVGTVTRPGLGIAVGEPAINPAPRRMIEATIAQLAARHGAPGDVEVTLSIPGGEEMAAWHLGRAFGAGHHRHRQALFVLVLDLFDPERHRRRPRRRLPPHRRRHRAHLGARGAGYVRPG